MTSPTRWRLNLFALRSMLALFIACNRYFLTKRRYWTATATPSSNKTRLQTKNFNRKFTVKKEKKEWVEWRRRMIVNYTRPRSPNGHLHTHTVAPTTPSRNAHQRLCFQSERDQKIVIDAKWPQKRQKKIAPKIHILELDMRRPERNHHNFPSLKATQTSVSVSPTWNMAEFFLFHLFLVSLSFDSSYTQFFFVSFLLAML